MNQNRCVSDTMIEHVPWTEHNSNTSFDEYKERQARTVLIHASSCASQ